VHWPNTQNRAIRAKEKVEMDISRKLGIIVFFGVPAIIGGGIVYWATNGNYIAVGIYEVLLYVFAGGLISR
jgi:hypothetical protein